MTNEQIILTEDQKTLLNRTIDQYRVAQDEYASSEAKRNAINSTLKFMLNDYGISKYESDDGSKLSMSSRPNVKWDEDKLLAYCETLNVDGLVKTKKYVDMDALESAIYNGRVQAESLKPYQIVKPDIVTLKLTQSKILKG
jgi:hypothetical protein